MNTEKEYPWLSSWLVLPLLVSMALVHVGYAVDSKFLIGVANYHMGMFAILLWQEIRKSLKK